MSDLISREAAIMKICEGGRTAAALANLVALPAIDAKCYRLPDKVEFNSVWYDFMFDGGAQDESHSVV